MALSEQEREAVRELAHQAVHNTDMKSWTFRCEICTEAVKIIMDLVQCDRTTAMQLYVAWTMENAAVIQRDSHEAYKKFLRERMVPLAEEQLKEMRKGEDWDEHA